MKTVTDIRRLENRQSWGLPELPQLKGGVLRRSVIFALIIGSALTMVNQFHALFGSDLIQIVPLILVYATPFVVIAISQLAAIRQAWLDAKEERVPRVEEHFVATAFSHGIPARAVTIGLILGVINSAIILAGAFLRTGDIVTAPVALIGQAYALPVLFGFLSQTMAYRRAAKLITE